MQKLIIMFVCLLGLVAAGGCQDFDAKVTNTSKTGDLSALDDFLSGRADGTYIQYDTEYYHSIDGEKYNTEKWVGSFVSPIPTVVFKNGEIWEELYNYANNPPSLISCFNSLKIVFENKYGPLPRIFYRNDFVRRGKKTYVGDSGRDIFQLTPEQLIVRSYDSFDGGDYRVESVDLVYLERTGMIDLSGPEFVLFDSYSQLPEMYDYWLDKMVEVQGPEFPFENDDYMARRFGDIPGFKSAFREWTERMAADRQL